MTYNDLAKKARDPTTATYLKENYLQVPSSIQDSLFLLGNPSATVSDLVKKKIDLVRDGTEVCIACSMLQPVCVC